MPEVPANPWLAWLGHNPFADWVDFAMKPPANVIRELLGLASSPHSRFKHWVDDLTSITA